MFRKLLSLLLVLTASGLVHAQIPISGLPQANLPLQPTDKVIVNQTISGFSSTRAAQVQNFTSLAPPISATYILQSPNALIPNSRRLLGTANQVILTDGGPLGNLTLSLPQSIAVTSTPTFAGLTLTGPFAGTSGTFSGTLSSAGYTGTTGAFSGALSSVGYSGTTGTFTGALSALSLSLTNPLPATSGGTGQSGYAIGDLLSADSTTTLSRVPDVSVGSYLRSGGVNTLPLWSTLKLPNSAVQGDVFFASAANTMGNLADVASGSYLRSGGVGANPVWSTTTVPNTAVLGDIWYGSASNVVSALTGNITTTKQFLTQTGSGAVSAAPAWGTIAAADLPGSFSGFANPTGTIGLSAVNGAATTAPRSDSAPALSQAIAPTWSAQHIFSKSFATSGTSGDYAIFEKSATPAFALDATGAAADAKVWELTATNTDLLGRISNDAGSTTKNWLDVTRAANVLTGLALNNATDNAPTNILGTGLVKIGGGTTVGTGVANTPTGQLQVDATAGGTGATNFHICNSSNAANLKCMAMRIGSTGSLALMPESDALVQGANNSFVISKSSSQTTSQIDIGNTTDLPPINTLGRIRSATGSWTANSGTATTVFTVPNVGATTYMVTCYSNIAADANSYSAVAVVSSQATSVKSTTIQTATLMTITISSANIQCTQSSGASGTFQYAVLRWGE